MHLSWQVKYGWQKLRQCHGGCVLGMRLRVVEAQPSFRPCVNTVYVQLFRINLAYQFGTLVKTSKMQTLCQ
jgi:hypothetical protein